MDTPSPPAVAACPDRPEISPSELPSLPVEVLCGILEYAIENEAGMALKVMLLCKRIKALMQPVIYRTGYFEYQIFLDGFLRYSSPEALNSTKTFCMEFLSDDTLMDDASIENFPTSVFEKCRHLSAFIVRTIRKFAEDDWKLVPKSLQRLSVTSFSLTASTSSLFPNLTHLHVGELTDWRAIHDLPSLKYLLLENGNTFPSIPLPDTLRVCIYITDLVEGVISAETARAWVKSIPASQSYQSNHDSRIIVAGCLSLATKNHYTEVIQQYLPDNEWQMYFRLWPHHWAFGEVDEMWEMAEQVVKRRKEKMK